MRAPSLLLLALLAAVCTAAAAVLPDESAELVAEFRRYYSPKRPAGERFEAVHVLKDIDTRAAAEALLEAFEDEDFSVRRAAIEIVGGYRAEATARFLMDDVLLERKYSRKTLLRASVAEALGGMGHDFAYWPLAGLLGERDPALRLAGIRALGLLGNPDACASLSELMDDPDPVFTLAALESLVQIKDVVGAEAAVLQSLSHDDWRVRSRAILAIEELRLKSGIRGLIQRLRVEEGRLAGDAYATLKLLTQRQFPDNPDQWEIWWDRTEARFVMPDLEKIAAARKAEAEKGTQYSKGGKSFGGIETRSENILFVIDISGSMETPFGNLDRLRQSGRTYSSTQRLGIVKEELIQTIQDLPDSTGFNILSFATDVKFWKKLQVKANVLNKSNAERWVGKLKPLGGKRAGFRAQTGLLNLTNDEGSTNTHLALLTALGEPPEGRRGNEFVITRPDTPLDTIFFLTDGEPTVGEITDMHKIRAEVRRVNEFRRIQLHVIYVGEFPDPDFEKLAHENDGVFVSIGG
jgi:HEAT repeat protein